MFDILTIDWGSVRFGMAFGSTQMGLVVPCQYNCYNKEIWEVIDREITTRKIQTILVGMPMTRQLKPTEVTLKVVEFVETLKTKYKVKYPQLKIETINERNTTQKALSKIRELTKHGINHNSAVEICNLYFLSKV